jgi:hypothetical protein
MISFDMLLPCLCADSVSEKSVLTLVFNALVSSLSFLHDDIDPPKHWAHSTNRRITRRLTRRQKKTLNDGGVLLLRWTGGSELEVKTYSEEEAQHAQQKKKAAAPLVSIGPPSPIG